MTDTLTFLFIIEHDDEKLIFCQAAELAFPRVSCFFANSCDQAIASVKAKLFPQPDIIFMNWPAPPYEPLGCFQQLQSAVELKGTHVVGLSDHSQYLERSWRNSAGVKQVIEKHRNVALLSDAIFKVVYNIN